MRGLWTILYLSLATLCCGCGVDELTTPTALHLRGLAICYMDCAVSNGGAGPADKPALLKHMRNMQDFQLSSNDLDPTKIESAFVSERDQQEFVFRYGTPINVGQPNPKLLAHEQTGVNGRRLAVLANGELELIDEGRFKKLTEE